MKANKQEVRTYRVYYRDGNQKLFEAPNVLRLVQFLGITISANVNDVIKIEEVQE